jgi:hypothetical protein
MILATCERRDVAGRSLEGTFGFPGGLILASFPIVAPNFDKEERHSHFGRKLSLTPRTLLSLLLMTARLDDSCEFHLGCAAEAATIQRINGPQSIVLLPDTYRPVASPGHRALVPPLAPLSAAPVAQPSDILANFPSRLHGQGCTRTCVHLHLHQRLQSFFLFSSEPTIEAFSAHSGCALFTPSAIVLFCVSHSR